MRLTSFQALYKRETLNTQEHLIAQQLYFAKRCGLHSFEFKFASVNTVSVTCFLKAAMLNIQWELIVLLKVWNSNSRPAPTKSTVITRRASVKVWWMLTLAPRIILTSELVNVATIQCRECSMIVNCVCLNVKRQGKTLNEPAADHITKLCDLIASADLRLEMQSCNLGYNVSCPFCFRVPFIDLVPRKFWFSLAHPICCNIQAKCEP